MQIQLKEKKKEHEFRSQYQKQRLEKAYKTYEHFLSTRRQVFFVFWMEILKKTLDFYRKAGGAGRKIEDV